MSIIKIPNKFKHNSKIMNNPIQHDIQLNLTYRARDHRIWFIRFHKAAISILILPIKTLKNKIIKTMILENKNYQWEIANLIFIFQIFHKVKQLIETAKLWDKLIQKILMAIMLTI
jgi:hypothetical protein